MTKLLNYANRLYLFVWVIDETYSVKMAGYGPSSFLRVYGPRLRLGP